VAYVFGEERVPKGRHLLPGETTMTESRKEKNGHPCPRSLSHLIFLIASMTKEEDIIFDPFIGSGTTAIAAEKTGRRCFGMEIDPAYCDVIVNRWQKFTGGKAKKI